MKKIISIFFVAIICLAACKDKKTDSEKTGDESTTTTATPVDPAKDSADIKAVVTDFYNWYSKNAQKLTAFDLYNGIKKADEAPYKIEWNEVDKLHRFIHDSVPQLGEAFLASQKRMLHMADSALGKMVSKDDVPPYFDYDWYTNSQDVEYTLEEINKARWRITTNGDDGVANIVGVYENGGEKSEQTLLKIKMKREAGQWKIAEIGGAEED